MNTTSINLINLLTQSQQSQPNAPMQTPFIQPIYSSQSQSLITNSIQTFPYNCNQLLTTIQPQQILSYSPQHLNDYHRIKPEQPFYNPLLHSRPSVLKLIPNTNPGMNPQNITNHNHIIPPSSLQSSLPIKQNDSDCTSVMHCPCIKRIVKLGVLHTKYGAQNTQRIADFVDRCQEFSDLNQDYQHSILCHLGSNNKDLINQMSKEYMSIYEFIDNFKNKNNQIPSHRQVSVQELAFYNETMDTIYTGVKPTADASRAMKIEVIDLLSDDKMDGIGDDNSSNSSNTTHSQPFQAFQHTIATNTNTNHILPIHNNYNHNIIPLFVQSTPSINAIPSFPSSIESAIHNQAMQPIITSIPPNININPHPYQSIPIQKLNTSFNNNMIHQIVQKTMKSPHGHSTTNETKPLPKNEPQYTRAMMKKYTPFKTQTDRKFKCNFCGKQYKHLCNLKSHQKVHTDEALVCPHCNKRFGRKANYKEHIRIHTGETPYECEYCQRKFKHHHSWKDHIRIHTGEKPYKCQICSKRFKVGHNLTVHLRIHTGEKPYNCSVCMKAFRQKSALNSHLKRVHH